MENSAVNIHGDLINRCKEGDQAAQYELYQLYVRAMFNTAVRIVGNQDDAEDVLQEAFVSAFRNLKSYRAEASFGSWLKRIVVNKAITFLRKSKRSLEVSEEYEEVPEEEASMEYPYSVQQVRYAVEKLPDGFRSVLTLYLFEGYDHQEISEILGISESTSKTQYKRAKEKLRTILIQEVNYG